MIPRHIKVLLLLLPLFIARSMLPIGFMLSFEEGSARLVFCPSQVEMPGEPASAGEHDAHSMHHGHGHDHGAEESEPDSVEHSHQTCPFAFAAAAPLSAADVFAPETPSSQLIVSAREAAISTLEVRSHPIRGPPALS